jgi:hypothetical protein
MSVFTTIELLWVAAWIPINQLFSTRISDSFVC